MDEIKSCSPKKEGKIRIDMTGWKMSENGVPDSRITVIRFDRMDKSKGAYWQCICSCGTIKSLLGTRLRKGTTLSCGCLRSEIQRMHMIELHKTQGTNKDIFRRQFSDMTGWVMSEHNVPKSKLIVIKFLGNTKTPKGQTLKIWQCLCTECGSIYASTGGHIRKGDVLTCGCGKHKPRPKTDKTNEIDGEA